MVEPEDPAEAALRLEQALERIAASTVRPHRAEPPVPVPVEATENARTSEVAERLDLLIAELRLALGQKGDA